MNSPMTAGFFTRGVSAEHYQLPHPPLGLPVILVIRRVLLRAFELLREEKMDLASASEDEITAALRSTIENRLRRTGEVAGFNRQKFEVVTRQGQCTNFDGTHPAKAPDFFFKLRDNESEPQPTLSEFEGLFVEAKPVDSTHSAGEKYCDDGLSRFVCGDYAWAMQEGMMLAYARDGRTIAGHLIPAISKPKRRASLAIVKIPELCVEAGAAACSQAEALHISQHRRDFQWIDGKGTATNITIYHLWHRC